MDLWGYVPADWHELLNPVRGQIDRIGEQLAAFESSGQQVLPAPDNIFRALQIHPSNVQVVIVGQDPYPNPMHACGVSFSVPTGTRPLPGSLRNIVAEVVADMGSTQITDGDLQPWVEQGVMLLNRTLTVSAGESHSHAALGWHEVTDRIIDVVVNLNPHVVGVLWGKQAQTLSNKFTNGHVVEGVHPSPLSAHRGFLGSRPFSHVNQIRKEDDLAEIKW